ncbi:MAG TPA: sulfatase-like hydrolase/transferase [Opitutaceae bacterium]|nr:sulfatase-like hydrolase/transferase [Opitutaceae bacterium]
MAPTPSSPASNAPSSPSRWRRGPALLLASRLGGAWILLGLYLTVACLVRVSLLFYSVWSVTWDASLLASFAWGFAFDLGSGLIAVSPLALALGLLPTSIFEYRLARVLAHLAFYLAIALLLFGAVAEGLFWDEFGVRFNFIAIDYLVYTTEVMANIRESYPLVLIITVLALVSAGAYALLLRTGWISTWLALADEPRRSRWRASAVWMAATVIIGLGLDSNWLPSFANTYNRELAKDGLWSLFAAFRNNELEYDQFYATLPVDDAFRTLQKELASDHSRSLREASDGRDTLRWVPPPRPAEPEQHLNVIQITVESLSADFLSIFNRASHLTPELTEIASKSLVFDQFYATGTRTDRGMEALTLALPPTPGRSLLKRPKNENLFTLGSVFRSRGYDTAFIYGGYGYFDNMNTFFSGNGYRIVDRASVSKSDITFANAWGACDGDLFRWTLREADASAATGKPFHYFVMTTSNHRPYTYPEGAIDLPPKVSGRAGAVKYTDFAIGQFLREAATKPWYKNTVFVIVADHCASVAGKTALPVQNYHIPLIVFTPGGQIAPGHVTSLTSQVDYAPTLLGLLNWSYASRFFGWDVLHASGDRRALIGNYQRIALYEPGILSVLRPMRGVDQFHYNPATFSLTPKANEEAYVHETIAYYQTASYLYRNGRYRALTAEDQERLVLKMVALPDERARLAVHPKAPRGDHHPSP